MHVRNCFTVHTCVIVLSMHGSICMYAFVYVYTCVNMCVCVYIPNVKTCSCSIELLSDVCILSYNLAIKIHA